AHSGWTGRLDTSRGSVVLRALINESASELGNFICGRALSFPSRIKEPARGPGSVTACWSQGDFLKGDLELREDVFIPALVGISKASIVGKLPPRLLQPGMKHSQDGVGTRARKVEPIPQVDGGPLGVAGIEILAWF